ncbi:hypothetical protein, partial [Acinetobacter baumannii]|uniref:hypothetical protein n=1 Tax=Acinetobacter baumannii TaxID=470 RepID=UPI00339944B6
RNKVTSLIREDKHLYQLDLVRKMERNPKLLYRIINGHSKLKPGVASVHTVDGMTETTQATADSLASFYAQVSNAK